MCQCKYKILYQENTTYHFTLLPGVTGNTNSWATASNFTNFDSANWNLILDSSTVNHGELTFHLEAIPEPATWALWLSGVALWLTFARRRKNCQ